MENLLAMPVRPAEVMLGKIMPYIVVGYIQVTVILLAARFLFQVPMAGSLVLLSLVLVVFIAANLSIGFTFSTVAANQLQAMQMAFFFLPSILLSGFMFPYRGMPQWAQTIGEVLPLTHFLRIVRGILLKGSGWTEIAGELWPLVAFMGRRWRWPCCATAAPWIDAGSVKVVARLDWRRNALRAGDLEVGHGQVRTRDPGQQDPVAVAEIHDDAASDDREDAGQDRLGRRQARAVDARGDDDDIGAGFERRYRVAAAAAAIDEPVGAGPAAQQVVAVPAGQRVRATAAIEAVVTGIPATRSSPSSP